MDLDRIKRNVAKMAAQNAPEEDIDGYIASEGATIDMVRDHKIGASAGPVSWADVPGKALENLAPSAAQFVDTVTYPIRHPIDTVTGLKDIGVGLASKAAGAVGIPQDQEAKAKREASADAVGQFLKDRYGGVDQIKNTLATDPVGAMADAATVLTGGGALAARAPGAVGTAGRVASTAGRAIDPVSAAARAGGAIARGGGRVVAEGLGVTTGVGAAPIENAFKAGRHGSQAFLDHMRGNAPLDDAVNMAENAVEGMQRDRSAAYKAGMANVTSSTKPLDFNPIINAALSARDKIVFKGFSKSGEATDTFNKIAEMIRGFKDADPALYHTAEGLDALKQSVGEIMQKTQQGTLERKVASEIYNAIKGQIVKQAPEYAKTMQDYTVASDQIREARKALSINDKATTDTKLRKLQSTQRNNVNASYGHRQRVLDELAQYEPELPMALAGQSLSQISPRGLARVGPYGAFGTGMMNPMMLASLPAMSPRLVGEAAYYAGRGADMGGEAINALARYAEPETMQNALMSLYAAGVPANALERR